jgi:DNA (cytosine-5)-methyltransferase 1
MAVRRLTPRECERLQGFIDDWTRVRERHYAKRQITDLRPAERWEPAEGGGWWLMTADGPRYQQLGNSMAVPVLRWIGERIDLVEALMARRNYQEGDT